MTKKDEVISTMILISSMVRDINGKTKKVSKLEKTINDNLIKMFDTGKRKTVIGRFGMAYDKPLLDKEVYEIQDKVAEAWTDTKKEYIPKDGEWFVSMSELITQLLNTLNRNEYQYILASEKVCQSAINSFSGHVSGRETTQEEIDHARILVNSFRDKVGIKKFMGLSRLKYNIEQNRILEGHSA